MTPDESIGIAFVGAGLVAHMHARAVAECAGAQLIGVYDLDAARAEALTARYGGRAFQSLDHLLEHPRVQAVHVLTPPAGHVAASLASLRAGKHVLVEKPVADTLDAILELKRVAEEHHRAGVHVSDQ